MAILFPAGSRIPVGGLRTFHRRYAKPDNTRREMNGFTYRGTIQLVYNKERRSVIAARANCFVVNRFLSWQDYPPRIIYRATLV